METSNQTSTPLGDNLTERAHSRFVDELLRRRHSREPWTRGHFAEPLVAELLEGSELAAHSAVAHDIEWHDGEDELRRCWADVAVLFRHDDYRIDSGWTFYVLPAGAEETWPSKTLQPRSLIEAGYLPLEAPSVSEAVGNAATAHS